MIPGRALAEDLQPALPVIPLGAFGALRSAMANDKREEFVYVAVRVPADETLLVQERLLPVYHALRAMVE